MVLFNIFLVIALLVFSELILRLLGQIPGYTGARPGEFLSLNLVDSLEVFDNFCTYGDSIFRANPEWHLMGEQNSYINSDGFRGTEFSNTDTSKKRILFIGDSFTWGGRANPITESFVDLIEREGYICFNTGIPGTGPNQYQLIAEKYVTRLKPDLVCLMFYMANDVVHRKTKLGPYQNACHITNAGWLNPYIDNDEHLSTAQEAYDYYFRRHTIPGTDSIFIQKVFASTVITTKLWYVLSALKIIKFQDPLVENRINTGKAHFFDEPVSYDYLKAVKKACDDENVPFHIFVIPVHTEVKSLHWKWLLKYVIQLGRSATTNIERDYPLVFRELKYHVPDNLIRSDYYEWPDGHFNNEGHRKFADYVLRILKSEGQI